MTFTRAKNAGFTLIELLVVISIIALLSSVVLGSVNTARKKALNAKMASEVQSMMKALEVYKTTVGTYPCEGTGGCWLQDYCGDTSLRDGFQPLVTAKVLSSVPRHPANTSCSDGYNYYFYWYGYEEPGYSEFADMDAKCGGRPVRKYMVGIISNQTLPKGLGNMEQWGDTYTEYQCVGL